MSELEDVSFWPGSSDGSYSRVGQAHQPMVSCRRRTVLIIVAVVALSFIIAVAIPAGMLQHIKSTAQASSPGDKAQVAEKTSTLPTSTSIQTASKPTKPKPNSTVTPTTTPQPTPKPSLQYRLPVNVKPSQYDISIQLDVTWLENNSVKGVIPYNGTVIIKVRVVTATKVIVMHAHNMTLSKVKVAEYTHGQLGNYNDVVPTPRINETFQQVEITLNKTYPANTTLSLRIDFNSTLNDGLNGFYQSTSGAPSGSILATTQFEPVYARSAFPCFDEPNFKATFALNITRPKGWISLFNTKRLHTEGGKNGPQTDFYGPSPVMSTYLVAFIVCDFNHTTPVVINSTKTNKTITITVYGQQNQLEQLEYATNITGRILKAYEDFFQISYPLPKLDIVAIPDFEAGAMENWGLVTFREAALLYDKDKSSSRQKQNVAYTIAHELAHQWFGNYVTMNWWNELWLNEGFATFVGQLIGVKAVNDDGEWPLEEDFRAGLASSLMTDSLLASHALSQNENDVNSGHQIEAMFDAITYIKGSGVLNMLYNYVGQEKMKTALQQYLTTHAHSNAKAADLWAAFDQVMGEGSKKKQITKMMNLWSHNVGHPVILTNYTTASLSITQEPFFLCKTCNKTGHLSNKWIVPVNYRAILNNGTFQNQKMILKNTSGSINSSNVNFTVLNSGWNGYYRVKYLHHSRLLQHLPMLSDIDAGNIIQDSLQLYRAGYMDSKDFYSLLKTASTLPKSHYLTWRMLLNCMGYISDFYGTDAENFLTVAKAMYQWLDVGSMNLSYSAVEALNVTQRTILNSRLALALNLDHEKALVDITQLSDLAGHAYQMLMNKTVDNGGIHEDIARQVMICAYLSNESLDLSNMIWAQYGLSNVPSTQDDYLMVMSSGKDIVLLRRYLEYGMEKAKDGDKAFLITLVAANRYGRNVAWEYVKENWDTLYAKYGMSLSMARIVKHPIRGFSSEYRLNEVKQFFNGKELGSGQRAYKQSLELIQTNIYTMQSTSKTFLEQFA